jgi:hypothetical protein
MIDEFTAARQEARQLCDRARLLEARARHAREQARAAWLACERLVQRTATAQAPGGLAEPSGDDPSTFRTG